MKPATKLAAVRDLSRVQCVGYLRVSSESQAASDRTSVEDQRTAIAAKARALGLEVGAWFTDPGFSGTSVEGRPDFRALIASCQAHQRPIHSPGVVLFLNESRFGRFADPDEAGHWRHVLRACGWTVRYVENDDAGASTAARHLMRAVGDAQAGEYSANLSRNTRRGMRGSADAGYWTREAPFGYRRQVVGSGEVMQPGQHKRPGERVRLVPHAEEAVAVQRIFERYAGGAASIRSLARELATSESSREWSPRAVQLVLSNRAYLGDVVSGRRSKQPDSYGKTGAHEAIVSRVVFERAQARMAANRSAPRKPESDWLLSGLVTCADCGQPYVAGGLGSRLASGQRSRFYADRGGRDDMKGGKRCDGPMGCVTKHLLEGATLGEIEKVLASPVTQRRIEQAVDRYLTTMGSNTGRESDAAKVELSKLEKQRDRLVAAVEDGTLTSREARPRLDAVRAKIEAVSERIHALAFQKRQNSAAKEERAALLATASDFATAITVLPPHELRPLLAPWLQSGTFNKRSRELVLHIHRVPAVAPLVLNHSPGPVAQDQDVEVRRVRIGGSR